MTMSAQSHNIQASSSLSATKTTKNDNSKLEEEYSKMLSKVNELIDKKNELTNTIKLKNSNRDLMKKARYAATGSESFGKRPPPSNEMSFSLMQVILAFGLMFLAGIYMGRG